MVKAIIKRYWRPLLAVWATCALGIAVVVGLSGGCLSLERSTEGYLASYRYYDASITTDVTGSDVESTLGAVRGVAHVDARMVANSVMVGPNQRVLSIRAITYAPDDWQRFVVWESVPTEGRDAVMVEYEFALDNGIGAGDEVRIRVDGTYRPCVVEALVSAPETLSIRALDAVSSLNSDFGYVYVPVELVAREPNHSQADAQAELERRQSELDEAQLEAQQGHHEALDEFGKAQAELERRVREARAALETIAELRTALDDRERIAQDGLAAIGDKERELSRARNRLESVRRQLADALRQLMVAQDTLEQRRAELEQARTRLTSSIGELEGHIALLEQAVQALATLDSKISQMRALSETMGSEQMQVLVHILQQMDPDTPLSVIVRAVEVLGEFRSLYEEYGGALDLSGAPQRVAEVLIGAMDTVEADCLALNDPQALDLVRRIDAGEEGAAASEEGQALARIVVRYTGQSLSEQSLQLSASRSRQLRDLVVSGGLRSLVEDLATLSGYGYEDWSRALAGVEGTLETILSLVGDDHPPIETVGQLLDAYDKLPATIASALSELEAARAEVLAQLADADVREQDITEVLGRLRSSAEEAKDGLEQVEEGLAAIDDALAQARTGAADLAGPLAQTDGGLAQVEAGADELSRLRHEAVDALRLIDEARGEIDAAEVQARDGLDALDELGAQLEARRLDAEDQWMQGLIEFSGLRDELERARAELDSWEGYQAFHNQFLLWFDEGVDPETTIEAARAALGAIEVKSSFTYADSPVKSRLDDNVVPLRALSYFMPAVFFGVVLIVAFLFMSLMVRQSRVSIGILRALGKSVGQVRALFCCVGLLVTMGAIPAGLALGWALVRYTASYYSDFFKLPEFVCLFDANMLVVSLVLIVAVVQLATVVGTTLVAAIQPSEAFSRAVPLSTRVPRAIRLLTGRLDELSKFSVLSLLRNPLRLGFSVACMGVTVAIILASQSFIASKNHLVHQEFDQRLHYDCQVFLSEDPDEHVLDELGELDVVRDLQRVGFYACTIACGDRRQDATVNAVQCDTDLIGIYDARGRRIAVPRHGIVLDDHLARELGVGVGDAVAVDGVALRVEALSRQDSNRVQYVSLETMGLLGKGSIGCVACRIDSAEQQRFMQALSERDDYVFAVFVDVLRSSMEHLYATYDLSAWILTSFAVAIGALVVLNVTQANMLERKRDLCVLRTLGFAHARLSRVLYCQTLLYVGLACLVGLPLGKLAALEALQLISTPDRSFPYANGVREYAATILIVVGYATASHLLAMRGMRAWDINEGVKDRE